MLGLAGQGRKPVRLILDCPLRLNEGLAIGVRVEEAKDGFRRHFLWGLRRPECYGLPSRVVLAALERLT